MKIDYTTVNPLDLSLDFDNPRFLKKLSDEAEMRLYLIEYEDSLSVADTLHKQGLIPGDMVVCVIEDGKTVVIEGNRRVSIMQMLLDRNLIPEKYVKEVPKVPDKILDEIKALNVQIIESRDLALSVMSNRHITGIKQWKPLAKKKFFASRFDAGMSIEQLALTTNIAKGEIMRDITDYKFFIRNYDKYKGDNPTFDKDIIDLGIDRFIRIFGTKMISDGEFIPVKDYLMMDRGENMEYISRLPDDVFVGFSQHVFEKAFDSQNKDAINTRSGFNDIPNAKEWRTRIDEARDSLPISSGDVVPLPGTPAPGTSATGAPTAAPPATVKQEPSGGPSAPKFMESLHWSGKLSLDNRDHLPMIRILKELHDMSSGNGKAYVRYPIAAAILTRSAYEQGLKLLIKTAGLWEDFESRYGNPRDQTLSVMENYVKTNDKKIMDKSTPLWKTFGNIKRGNYRPFLNDCTHDLDYVYPSKDKLEAFAGEGMRGFLQGIIDNAAEKATK